MVVEADLRGRRRPEPHRHGAHAASGHLTVDLEPHAAEAPGGVELELRAGVDHQRRREPAVFGKRREHVGVDFG